MYEIFEKLLKEHGVSAYKVSKETGVNQATLSEWKNGGYTPKRDKLEKIAEYFGVSVEYLCTGEINTGAVVDYQISSEELNLIVEVRKASNKDHLIEYARRFAALSDDARAYVEKMIDSCSGDK